MQRLPLVLLCAALLGPLCPASAAAAPALSVDWRQPIEKLAPMAWKPRVWATPTMSDDGQRLYCPSGNGLSTLSTASGALIWQVLGGDAIQGTPVERDGTLYVVTAGGAVRALAARTGKPVWPKPRNLDAVTHAAPTVGPRHVYIMSDPGLLTAIERQTGKIAWRHGRGVAREFLIEGHGAATLHKGVVYAGFADGRLVALAGRDGGLVWEQHLGDARKGPYTDCDSTPVIARIGPQVAVIAAAHNTGLFAHEVANGGQLWHYDAAGLGQPLVHGQRVYAVAGDAALHVLELAKGTRVYARKLAGEPSGRLAMAGPWLLVPGGGGMELVDARNGFGLARIIDDFGFAAAPLRVGRRLFSVSNGGIAWSLRLR